MDLKDIPSANHHPKVGGPPEEIPIVLPNLA